MNQYKEKVIKYYGQCLWDYQPLWRLNKYLAIHNGFYDNNNRTHGQAVINMNRVLAKISKIKPESKVLDVGCGVGGSSIWLAKKLGVKAIGIDIGERQIEMAKKFAKKYKVDNLVKFYIRDFLDTKFPQDSFDVVWGIESVCHAENKRNFLLETKRILKERGRLIIADAFLKKENLIEQEKKKMKQWFEGWVIPNLASVKEFQEYLEELGFRNIRYIDVTKNVMPSVNRLYYIIGVPLYPIVKILKLIGIDKIVGIKNRMRMGEIISAYYCPKTLKKGLWIYGIFCAEK